jgi:hypothetical protein
MPTSKADMEGVMNKVFTECHRLRGAGQAEYAHKDDNAFANFERVAERIGINRESVLMVYAEKHIDGIHSFIKGHKSQREDVRGRINDVIVYLCLLRGMIDEMELVIKADEHSQNVVGLNPLAINNFPAAKKLNHPDERVGPTY